MVPVSNGPYIWSRDWKVFAALLDDSVYLCGDSPVASKGTQSATASDPGFPFSIGPFEAEGFTCRYEGTEDELGTLKCDGVKKTWCQVMDDFDPCRPLNNPIMSAVVHCRW